jgi:hypothetical protein
VLPWAHAPRGTSAHARASAANRGTKCPVAAPCDTRSKHALRGPLDPFDPAAKKMTYFARSLFLRRAPTAFRRSARGGSCTRCDGTRQICLFRTIRAVQR